MQVLMGWRPAFLRMRLHGKEAMPLPEHRVLEHNRNQGNGEPSAPARRRQRSNGKEAMPLPKHRLLEHNRNQDNGEPSAPAAGVELPPAIRADLLDPALWQGGLAKYARGTNLAVALADAAGRLIGSTINPRPTWSLLHSKSPRPLVPKLP